METDVKVPFVIRAMRASNCDSRADDAVAELLAAAKAIMDTVDNGCAGSVEEKEIINNLRAAIAKAEAS